MRMNLKKILAWAWFLVLFFGSHVFYVWPSSGITPLVILPLMFDLAALFLISWWALDQIAPSF